MKNTWLYILFVLLVVFFGSCSKQPTEEQAIQQLEGCESLQWCWGNGKDGTESVLCETSGPAVKEIISEMGRLEKVLESYEIIEIDFSQSLKFVCQGKTVSINCFFLPRRNIVVFPSGNGSAKIYSILKELGWMEEAKPISPNEFK